MTETKRTLRNEFETMMVKNCQSQTTGSIIGLKSLLVFSLMFQGCSSLGSLTRLGRAEKDPFESAVADQEDASDSQISQVSHTEPAVGSAQSMRDFSDAEALYKAGEYSKAEGIFQAIADRFESDETGKYQKRTLTNFYKPLESRALDYSANPLHEDALLYVAECKYAQKRYPGAQDVYQKILKVHPGTRHLNKVSQRLFEIAMIWLDVEPVKNEDIKLASFSTEGAAPRPEVKPQKDWNRPSFFSFTDRSRPIADTEGRALQALKSIWMNDPTGELADDAIMLSGSHYLRVGRFTEASDMFRLLRDEYPNSRHYKEAYLLGAHVTQASYQGAEYDGAPLVNSRQLRQTALQAFSLELTPEQKARLKQELSQLDEAVVAREFKQVELYLKKGKYDAVEIYCHDMINTYPESQYSKRAQQILAALPELRNGSPWLAPWSARDVISKVSQGKVVTPRMSSEVAQPEPEAEEKGSSLFKMPGLPKLKPVPIPKLPSWGKSKEEELADPFSPSVSSQQSEDSAGRATIDL